MENWTQDIIKALEDRTASGTKKNLYNSEFFKSHLKYKPIYDFIGDMIITYFELKSVADFGCGCGFLLERLWRHGVEDVFGIEGSPDVAEFWKNELPEALVKNLVVGNIFDYNQKKQYDMVVCMEVAEHLKPEHSDKLVDIICNSSNKWIWWSAAQVGQGGVGHVNCRPLSYWEKKFEEHGFEADWELTYKIKFTMLQNHAICLSYFWFRDNLCIYRRI